jgi:hypothetical protein
MSSTMSRLVLQRHAVAFNAEKPTGRISPADTERIIKALRLARKFAEIPNWIGSGELRRIDTRRQLMAAFDDLERES